MFNFKELIFKLGIIDWYHLKMSLYLVQKFKYCEYKRCYFNFI